jgi:thioesterase domain-containing protein
VTFETELSAAEPAWLADHQVFGRIVVPGALTSLLAYMAGTLVGVAERNGIQDLAGLEAPAVGAIVLQDLEFLAPLVLPLPDDQHNEAARRVQVVTGAVESGERVVKIFGLQTSPTGVKSWVQHASGCVVDGPRHQALASIDLSTLRPPLGNQQGNDVQSSPAGRGTSHGRAVPSIRTHWSSGGEAVAELVLNSASDCPEMPLHPALLEGCFQLGVGMLLGLSGLEGNTYVPANIESLWLKKIAAREIMCRARLRGTVDDAGLPTADLALYVKNGEVVGEVLGLRMRPASRHEFWPAEDSACGLSDEARSVEVSLSRLIEGSNPIDTSNLIGLLKASDPDQCRSLLLSFLQNELQAVLGLASLPGPMTSFYDFGMDSLLTIQFFNRLTKVIGSAVQLPTMLAFDYPSLEKLVDYLCENLRFGDGGEQSAIAYNPIINFNSSTADQPNTMFCIHDVTGQAFGFSNLVSPLEDLVSVAGIQSPSLMSGQKSFETYDEMIESYAFALGEDAEEQQPIVLLGWSMGGLIAHDLACRLTRAGRRIAGLVILDAPGDAKDMALLLPRLMAPHNKVVTNKVNELFHARAEFEEFIFHLTKDVLNVDAVRIDRLKHVAKLIPGLGQWKGDMDNFDTSQLESILRMFHCNMLLLNERSALATGYFSGRTLLVRALETREMPSGPTLGWNEYCAELDIVDVAFSHTGLMDKQASAVIGRVIGDWLERRGEQSG